MPKDTSRKQKQKTSESEESPREKLKTQVKHFGEEAGALGKKVGEKGEAIGKQLGAKGEEFGNRMGKRGGECCGRHRPFGVVGLIFSILIGILGLGVSIWALEVLAERSGSAIFFSLHDFLFSNAGIFILIFIASAILTYISRCCRSGYILVSPVSAAFGITSALWIAANVAIIANADLGNPDLLRIAEYVPGHLWSIFFLFLILGYIFMMLRLIFGSVWESECTCGENHKYAAKESVEVPPANEPKRLYRSGKDKILGGVCGGIAEYLNVDPVLIRIIWVAFALAGGSGVLVYIIAWIIIPRNPHHVWKD